MTSDGALELTAQVDEKNLALLQPGQPARASADAFPGQVFDATVALHRPGGRRRPAAPSRSGSRCRRRPRCCAPT